MVFRIIPNEYFESIIKGKETHIKLDRKNIYTKSTMDIFEVPIFRIFDIQIKYNYNENNFKNIYYIFLKIKEKKICFNRIYNLIYGNFLKIYVENIEIIYYKFHLTHTK